ncbi:MAG: hypothetical protein QXU09_02050 [Thermoproteota archaeon]|nr:hypothetical protein [Candidatus Brockarchaeota archaeon]
MKGLGGLKITKALVLVILLEVVIIEAIALYAFSVVYSSSGAYDISGECLIIVFKKDYFFGKIKVTVIPYENSTVTLIFPSGEAVNITEEYTFIETLPPVISRWFVGLPDLIYNNSALSYEQYTYPCYGYVCRKEELGNFLPYSVTTTMQPYGIVRIKGKSYEIKTKILGVAPWNKS